MEINDELFNYEKKWNTTVIWVFSVIAAEPNHSGYKVAITGNRAVRKPLTPSTLPQRAGFQGTTNRSSVWKKVSKNLWGKECSDSTVMEYETRDQISFP